MQLGWYGEVVAVRTERQKIAGLSATVSEKVRLFLLYHLPHGSGRSKIIGFRYSGIGKKTATVYETSISDRRSISTVQIDGLDCHIDEIQLTWSKILYSI